MRTPEPTSEPAQELEHRAADPLARFDAGLVVAGVVVLWLLLWLGWPWSPGTWFVVGGLALGFLVVGLDATRSRWDAGACRSRRR